MNYKEVDFKMNGEMYTFWIKNKKEEAVAKKILEQKGSCNYPIYVSCHRHSCPFLGFYGCVGLDKNQNHAFTKRVSMLKKAGVKI